MGFPCMNQTCINTKREEVYSKDSSFSLLSFRAIDNRFIITWNMQYVSILFLGTKNIFIDTVWTALQIYAEKSRHVNSIWYIHETKPFLSIKSFINNIFICILMVQYFPSLALRYCEQMMSLGIITLVMCMWFIRVETSIANLKEHRDRREKLREKAWNFNETLEVNCECS